MVSHTNKELGGIMHMHFCQSHIVLLSANRTHNVLMESCLRCQCLCSVLVSLAERQIRGLEGG